MHHNDLGRKHPKRSESRNVILLQAYLVYRPPCIWAQLSSPCGVRSPYTSPHILVYGLPCHAGISSGCNPYFFIVTVTVTVTVMVLVMVLAMVTGISSSCYPSSPPPCVLFCFFFAVQENHPGALYWFISISTTNIIIASPRGVVHKPSLFCSACSTATISSSFFRLQICLFLSFVRSRC